MSGTHAAYSCTSILPSALIPDIVTTVKEFSNSLVLVTTKENITRARHG